MEFFNQAIDILKILVMALGAGLAVWGTRNSRLHKIFFPNGQIFVQNVNRHKI